MSVEWQGARKILSGELRLVHAAALWSLPAIKGTQGDTSGALREASESPIRA